MADASAWPWPDDYLPTVEEAWAYVRAHGPLEAESPSKKKAKIRRPKTRARAPR